MERKEIKEAYKKFNESMIKSTGLTIEQLKIMNESAEKQLNLELKKVTRIEVIDQFGRSYVNKDPSNEVEISLQDDKKTLKVFISRDKSKCEHDYEYNNDIRWKVCMKCGHMPL